MTQALANLGIAFLARFDELQLAVGDLQHVLYVGDRQLEDVKGGGGVGMGTVWLNRSGTAMDPQLPAPDHQIDSLLEIPELLDRLSGTKDGAQ